MKEICQRLKNDIIRKTENQAKDPYKDDFQPKDLKLKASDYGSFSDHCKKGTTKSSKWDGCGLLECININRRPFRYHLLQRKK